MQVPAVRVADAHAPSATTDGLFARVPLLRPLAIRDFRLPWAGQAVSLLGDQFHMVALACLGVLSGAARVLDEPTGSGLPAER